MPQISVIVPVYKAENYIKQCVDSIISQKFVDFELILVDDGSPDKSPAMCDECAAKDNRIKVIHKENGGVSSARNCGLDCAEGDYVVFIDSDDYAGENYLSDLIEAQSKNENGEKTLLITDYQPFDDTGFLDRKLPDGFTVKLNGDGTAAQEFKDLVFGFRVFPPYCKLYSRRVIEENDLRFNTGIRTAEDFDFNMRYMEYVEAVSYEPNVEYYYRVGYKKYTPSNRGVLGDSEIKSAHVMANGIVCFAKRMGVYEACYDDICKWAAKKHFFNRMPMLFAINDKIGYKTRRKLYKRLVSDRTYRKLFKHGISLLGKSTTRLIGKWFDFFLAWWIFWKHVHKKQN